MDNKFRNISNCDGFMLIDYINYDPRFFVVTASIASQLEDIGSQVLHDGGHVDGGSTDLWHQLNC